MGNQGKWQAIMALEIKYPKNMLTFSAKDLVLSEINRTNGSFDHVSKIMSHRVLDFIRGEEMNLDAPCSFVRRKNKEPRKKDTVSLSYEV